MSKTYSYQFKLNVVQAYLDGPLGYHLLAKKYKVKLSGLSPVNYRKQATQSHA
ncbi:transposase [Dolosigranulum pigrum]|jgi:hypothetical protein|uniref:transposase n=1 Tax=Dolosigranulum pigrum TaxID=29394 RepID=UPI001AD87B99|nr:transposase [Dolosigranulum pigrum]QTJ37355.1 transposase [Dolosigranulum pigrum]